MVRPKNVDISLASFGQAVKSYRTAAGLTQDEAATLAGLNVSYYGTVERGEKNISLLNILDVCRALKVPPSRLLVVLDELALKERPATPKRTRRPAKAVEK